MICGARLGQLRSGEGWRSHGPARTRHRPASGLESRLRSVPAALPPEGGTPNVRPSLILLAPDAVAEQFSVGHYSSAMKVSTSIRFALIAVLMTGGWLGMLTRYSDTGLLLLFIASLLYPRGEPDLSDSGMRRWLRGVGIRLIGLFVLGVFYYLVAHKIAHAITDPWFILPLWVISLFAIYRDWRKQKGMADA